MCIIIINIIKKSLQSALTYEETQEENVTEWTLNSRAKYKKAWSKVR